MQTWAKFDPFPNLKSEGDTMTDKDVFIRQEDGSMKPVTIPERLARRAAIYWELRKLGLDPDEIKFVWDSGIAWESSDES